MSYSQLVMPGTSRNGYRPTRAGGAGPCIGPVLAVLLAAAAASRIAAVGASLLVVSAVGLTVPFLLLGLGGRQRPGGRGMAAPPPPGACRRGRSLLAAMGRATTASWWTMLFAPLPRRFARAGWPRSEGIRHAHTASSTR